jgi:hypothetical protein
MGKGRRGSGMTVKRPKTFNSTPIMANPAGIMSQPAKS